MGLTSRARASRDLIALTVLAVLTEQPRHPYEMQRLMRERRKDFAIGKARSFYDAVNRLLGDGLVEPLETSREGKRPERTVYRITDEGREEFESWLGELLSTPVTEFPLFTVAVNFLGYLPVGVVEQDLQRRVVALEGEIAGLDAALRALQEHLHLPRLVLLEHEHTRALRQAELDWVRALVEDIRSGRLNWNFFLDWARQDAQSERTRPASTPPPVHVDGRKGDTKRQ